MNPAPVEIRIRSGNVWRIPLGEVWEYRDLLRLLVRRDFVAKYKQTILGPLWFILQPLLMTLIFTVIFGKVARLSTDETPHILFYMCGLLGWNYFSLTANSICNTFTANEHLFGKVYFPRLIVPLSLLCTNLFTFAVQFALFLAFWIYYKCLGAAISWNATLVLLPLVLAQAAALALGFGLCVSALTSRFRDLLIAMPLLFQIWMYATPVIMPLSEVPVRWRWVAEINPMTAATENLRCILLGTGTPSLSGTVLSLVVTSLILAAGLLLFARAERNFIDTI